MARRKVDKNDKSQNAKRRSIGSKTVKQKLNLQANNNAQTVKVPKQRRHRKGFRTIQEMKKLLKTEKGMIPFANICRAVKKALLQQDNPACADLKISRDAVVTFGRSVEFMIGKIFEMAGRRLAQEKKIKLQEKTLALTAYEWQSFMPTELFRPASCLGYINDFQNHYIHKQKKLD